MTDRVLLVGSFPPPYGGCSVHVLRLFQVLKSNVRVEVIDLYGSSSKGDEPGIVRCGTFKPFNALKGVVALLRRPVRLVHFHVAGMDSFLYAALPMLAALRRGTRRIVTIHSGSFVARFKQGPSWRQMMLRVILRRFDWIVTVNAEQQRFLESIGVDRHKIHVIPAFLPPVTRHSARAKTALQTLEACKHIVVSSGYGLPYYGFHFVVEAIESLGANSDATGLLICTYNTYDEKYIAALQRKIEAGFPGLILRDLPPDEFAWLLERCDVYVRATDRDGDAVAIREAQFFGKTVVASDCVERPSNVRVFKTNDSRALAQALLETNSSALAPNRTAESSELKALLDIYNEALTT